MLLVKDEYEVMHNFLLVDAHTHLRINKLEGLVPSEFIRKYSKIVKEVAMQISNNPKDFKFHFPWDLTDKTPDYYAFCQKDAFSIVHPGKDLVRSLDKYLGFDFIITFSSNMTSRLPRDYRSANSKIREALIEKSIEDNAPHNNLRFIGYGRLDPNHSDALDTFDNVFQLGLRGLKLHPKEETFEIESKRTIEILKRAAHYNMPVIFHTQEGMASKILEVVNSTIKDLVHAEKTDLLTRLKVILGHAPWNGVSNKELYTALSHPNIFGELSTLRPESYKDFFANSKSQILYERIFEFKHILELEKNKIEEKYFQVFGYNRFNYWSSKLLFGSDTPYPPSHSAPKLLSHLFSKEFVGNASDIQNILAISALKLIPPIAKPNFQTGSEKATTSSKFHQTKLDLLKKESKTLGIDPVMETFPRARMTGSIFSFLRDGKCGSWLFESLFDAKKPLNLVIPNQDDLSTSAISTGKRSVVRNIEMSLGES
jgi:predicted TIM-barrel fold metal-dependent hydrolase